MWTMWLLALQLAPVGSSLLHPETIRRHLRRLGWHWRKPKHESPRIGLKQHSDLELKDETTHLGDQLLSPSLGVKS